MNRLLKCLQLASQNEVPKFVFRHSSKYILYSNRSLCHSLILSKLFCSLTADWSKVFRLILFQVQGKCQPWKPFIYEFTDISKAPLERVFFPLNPLLCCRLQPPLPATFSSWLRSPPAQCLEKLPGHIWLCRLCVGWTQAWKPCCSCFHALITPLGFWGTENVSVQKHT